MSDYLSLAHAAECVAEYARECLRDQDNGKPPKTGTLRRQLEALQREIARFER